MLALVYDDSSKSVKLDEAYPKPQPGPGDALIRVHRAGICATVGNQPGTNVAAPSGPCCSFPRSLM
jgi:threonine dehydrogenase-like Zn-dependent dehydrogenase